MNSFKIRQNKYSDRFSTVVVLGELRKKLKKFPDRAGILKYFWIIVASLLIRQPALGVVNLC